MRYKLKKNLKVVLLMHLLNLSFREMAEINIDLQVSTETIVKSKRNINYRRAN